MLKELLIQEEMILINLKRVRMQIDDEKLRIAKEKFGVQAGSIVKDRDGIEYKVTLVDPRYGDKPWLSGNPRNKNGEFGRVYRNLYGNWSLVSTNAP